MDVTCAIAAIFFLTADIPLFVSVYRFESARSIQRQYCNISILAGMNRSNRDKVHAFSSFLGTIQAHVISGRQIVAKGSDRSNDKKALSTLCIWLAVTAILYISLCLLNWVSTVRRGINKPDALGW